MKQFNLLLIISVLVAITGCQRELSLPQVKADTVSQGIEAARDTIIFYQGSTARVPMDGTGELPSFNCRFEVFFHDTAYTSKSVFRLRRSPGCVLYEAKLYIDGGLVQNITITPDMRYLTFRQIIEKRILPEQEHTDGSHNMAVYITGKAVRGEAYRIDLVRSNWVHVRGGTPLPVSGLAIKGLYCKFR